MWTVGCERIKTFWFAVIGSAVLTAIIATPLPNSPISASSLQHQLQKNDKFNDLDLINKIDVKSANFQQTDDLFTTFENTLEDTNNYFDNSFILMENSTNPIQRFKQSIPVLEPVKHLLNTVGDGNFNHTTHFNKTRHHLVSPGEVGGNGGNETSTSSSAIETEAERDSAVNSSDFKLLDCLGSLGRMLWNVLGNIKQWFAASSGNAIAAASASGGL